MALVEYEIVNPNIVEPEFTIGSLTKYTGVLSLRQHIGFMVKFTVRVG